MKNIKNKFILVTILSTIVTISFVATSQARPNYQAQIQPLQKCLACHTQTGGGGPLSSFGSAFQSNGLKYQGLEEVDSDGDGFTNAQEIENKTLPGDPNSNTGNQTPWILYTIITIVFIAGTIALFVVAAKVRAKNEANNDE